MMWFKGFRGRMIIEDVGVAERGSRKSRHAGSYCNPRCRDRGGGEVHILVYGVVAVVLGLQQVLASCSTWPKRGTLSELRS